MKQLISILMAITAIALQAKDFDIDFQFTQKLVISGRMHNQTMLLNHEGRRIVCQTGKATIYDRRWLRTETKHSLPALCIESAPIDGIGKVIMLPCREYPKGDESCIRGIVYLIRDNGEWEQGVFSKRTLGWGKTESEIWEGYEFAKQCPDCGKAVGGGEYLKTWKVIRQRK